MSESESKQASRTYVRYSDDVEVVEPGEGELIQKAIAAMMKGMALTRPKHGRSVRPSHAKAHGLVKGELRVLEDLPPHLRQGLFSGPRTHAVVARLSHVPGDLDDDRKVSGPRGMSLEDAHAEWSEEESPYLPVARLVLPAQDAYDPAMQDAVDEAMSFCPAHSLAAHRPLGGIMRAHGGV